MDINELRVEVARLQENIKTLKDTLESLYKKIQYLETENIKRNEEATDSYYIAEMTRKRLEEQVETIKNRIDGFITSCENTKCLNNEHFKDLNVKISSLWLKIVGILGAGLIAGLFTEKRILLNLINLVLSGFKG